MDRISNADDIGTRGAVFGLALLFAGCTDRVASVHPVQERTPVAAPSVSSVGPETVSKASEPGKTELTPLEAASWVVPLAVPGFSDAMVAVPLGSREPRGLVVALHGNYDCPEWACGAWRAVAPEPFILCLRGRKRTDTPKGDDRYTYSGAVEAERELEAAILAVRTRFAERLLPSPAVYAGFSLGAIVGVPIASKSPAKFPRLVFVEGGHEGWTPARARSFQKGGGERVLFVCSQRGCLGAAKGAALTLNKAGVLTDIVDAGDHGHSYDGAVADATRTRWSWIRDGLSGFAPN